MKREELLNSPEYWTTKIQVELYNQVEKYMLENKLTRTKLAEKLGVTKGYVTQLLNGDFDHRLSKLVELSLAIGLVPQFCFEAVDTYVKSQSVKNATTSYGTRTQTTKKHAKQNILDRSSHISIAAKKRV